MSMSKTRSVRAGRRASAEARQAAYDKLTLQQKLDALPKDGAKKQRAKLEAALAKSKAKPQAVEPKAAVEPEVVGEPKPKAKRAYQKKAKE